MLEGTGRPRCGAVFEWLAGSALTAIAGDVPLKVTPAALQFGRAISALAAAPTLVLLLLLPAVALAAALAALLLPVFLASALETLASNLLAVALAFALAGVLAFALAFALAVECVQRLVGGVLGDRLVGDLRIQACRDVRVTSCTKRNPLHSEWLCCKEDNQVKHAESQKDM